MSVIELRKIAKQHKIKLTKNGKYKTMKELKSEINKHNETIKGGELSVNNTKDFLKQSYSKSPKDIDGYKIDKDLSGQRVQVYHNPQNNKTIVVHRGTNSIQDWGTNLSMSFGIKGKRFNHAKKIQKQAEEKYGKNNLTTLGHSQGAKWAEMLGNKNNNNEVITLNKPTLPLDLIQGKKVKKNQTDIKTSKDPVSVLRGLQKGKKARVLKSKTINPLTEHSVDVLNRLDENEMLGVPDNVNGGSLTSKTDLINKQTLLKQIYNYTKEDALNDYKQLPKNYNDFITLYKLKPNTDIGRKFVGYFTNLERLNTRTKSGENFWDFYKNRHNLTSKNYVKNMFKYYENNKNMTNLKIWWRLFNLYKGSINIFKPTIAMFVYYKYKPKSILDPTMGWGGRLVGASALNIFKYTGIDLNPNLKKPYNEMVKTLKPLTKTNIKLIFKNALKVDYSKIDYDLVLTSPPYYNIEIYNGTIKMNKEEWNNKFYKPLFNKTYTHLKKGGYYCLNVPQELYNNVCLDLFGEATEFLPLPKVARTKNETYKEYIYVWKK